MRERDNKRIPRIGEVLKYSLLLLTIVLILLGGKMSIFGLVGLFAVCFFRIIHWKYLFYAGLILMPVKTALTLYVGFNLHLSQILLFTALACALLDRSSSIVWKKGIFDNRIVACIFVLVISSFQSRFIPNDPVIIYDAVRNYPWIKSLSRIILISAFVFFAFFIKAFARNQKIVYELISVLIISSVVQSFLGIISFIAYYFKDLKFLGTSLIVFSGTASPRIRGFEIEPLFFGLYLLTITPLMIVWLLKNQEKGLRRKLLFVAVSLNVMAIFLTFSRSVWIGIAVSLLFLLITNYRVASKQFLKVIKTRWKYVFAASFFVMVVASPILILIDAPRITYNILANFIAGAINPAHGQFWSTRLRLLTWKIGINAFLKHPLLGIGIENFSFYSGNVFIVRLLSNSINYPEINNLPLKILVETGIVGFVIIGWFFWKSFVDIVRIMKRIKDPFLKSSLEGCCACIVGIGVQSIFFSNILSTYLWAFLGMILAFVNLSQTKIKI